MKKSSPFLFVLALVIGFFCCQKTCIAARNESASVSADIDKTSVESTKKEGSHRPAGWWRKNLTTVSAGKLTVVTSPDFAPYEFYAIDENGATKLSGFEMSLARYIADYIGLELEIITVDFDATMTELQTKSADLGMAGFSPKPERMNIMDFSNVFYTGGQSFVCLRKNREFFTSLEDTNTDDYSIGAQTGSIQFDLAQKYSPRSNIVPLPKATDIFADLLAGNLDGAYIETIIAQSFQKNYPELYIALSVPFEHEGSVVGVSKGNAELLAAVNEAIAAALVDGSMEKFIAEAVQLTDQEKCRRLSEEEKKN